MEAGNKYIINCKEYESSYIMVYNLAGSLVSCEFTGGFDEVQKAWWLKNTPAKYDAVAINALVKGSKGVLQKIPFELLFATFYDEYGNKEGRRKAERAWIQLSKEEQMKAFLYIKIYKQKVKMAGIAMAYPATYLNQQRWND